MEVTHYNILYNIVQFINDMKTIHSMFFVSKHFNNFMRTNIVNLLTSMLRIHEDRPKDILSRVIGGRTYGKVICYFPYYSPKLLSAYVKKHRPNSSELIHANMQFRMNNLGVDALTIDAPLQTQVVRSITKHMNGKRNGRAYGFLFSGLVTYVENYINDLAHGEQYYISYDSRYVYKRVATFDRGMNMGKQLTYRAMVGTIEKLELGNHKRWKIILGLINKLYKVSNYKNGYLDGETCEYFANGKLKLVMYYEAGKDTGLRIKYDRKGVLDVHLGLRGRNEYIERNKETGKLEVKGGNIALEMMGGLFGANQTIQPLEVGSVVDEELLNRLLNVDQYLVPKVEVISFNKVKMPYKEVLKLEVGIPRIIIRRSKVMRVHPPITVSPLPFDVNLVLANVKKEREEREEKRKKTNKRRKV